ncbi:hypothetical protein P153DRAFT_301965 [Dothidotthia symphoricarpi CBS 119687]|uniref:Lytic polysaccharide monooxygenase n=1 Tax=Dothidotthia symphoricarpi CBS 119687 TaxID=1392245 RepID=A0A6A6A1I9_9PLEO|nr:uncharacterized protein P153DRAFT_301965 [Dothidotthia symphoricarpi CBS 119687]KAF2124588.1 hypothetical protein P153DRAFT_301965 [Dothidotthia symphoricarpi CBS 119687]
MKLTPVFYTLFFAASSCAHSWLHCTDHNDVILEWMKENATLYDPPREVDPLMPWFSHLCAGWPRAKHNPGFWADESTNYAWHISAAVSQGDTHACHPDQRSPLYRTGPFAQPPTSAGPELVFTESPAPMATSRPGRELKLLFGGNGHSRGDNVGGHGDPGRVAVYWKGEPEAEIVDISEFTEENRLQEAGFSDESFAYPADVSVTTPPELHDKGNWLTLKL